MNSQNYERKLLLVIGDSLGAPRPWVGITIKRTYAYKIATSLNNDYFVANISVSENSSSKSTKESYLRTYVRNADISCAVIQIGIVDCAPRLLSTFDRLLGGLASRSKILSSIFRRYVNLKSRHRYWITKNFPRTLVPLPEFEKNYRTLIQAILNSNPVSKIILLDIAYPGSFLLDKSHNILDNIISYNDVIRKIANEYPKMIEVISVFEQTKLNPDWITPEDGHHILPAAHDWIANQLIFRIKGL